MLRSVALLSISLWGVSQAKSVLVPLILAAMLAFVLAPGVRFLKRHHVPEGLAMLCATFVFVVPLAAITYEAVRQGGALIHEIPRIVQHLQEVLNRMTGSPWAARLHLKESLSSAPFVSSKAGHDIGADLVIALHGARTFLTGGGELILTLVFSLLMLASRERLKRSAEMILSRGNFADLTQHPTNYVNSVAALVQRFLLVRVGIAVLVAGVDFVVLLLLGIPYPLFTAAFLGGMTIIPIVGFALGVIPPLFLALTAGLSALRIVLMLGALSLVSIAESHLLTPKLLGRHLDLNLLFTFLGLFVGERLWGGWGMFLSIPILGIIRITLAASREGRPFSQLLARDEWATQEWNDRKAG